MGKTQDQASEVMATRARKLVGKEVVIKLRVEEAAVPAKLLAVSPQNEISFLTEGVTFFVHSSEVALLATETEVE